MLQLVTKESILNYCLVNLDIVGIKIDLRSLITVNGTLLELGGKQIFNLLLIRKI